MKTFTAFEYILIDVANNYGLDGVPFEDRIEWATDNIDELETLGESIKETKSYPLYFKAVSALRQVQRGEPTGHLVGLDACASGMQVMSTVTGCLKGAAATGLIHPDERADPYTETTQVMSNLLNKNVAGERKAVKQGVMTSLYGSIAEPKKLFGDGTDELGAFYKAMYVIAKGACELCNHLIESWNPSNEYQTWELPDGYVARCPSEVSMEARIPVEELGGHRFTYQWSEVAPQEKAVQNAANVVHSLDAYLLRSLVRRCSYDANEVTKVISTIAMELLHREVLGKPSYSTTDTYEELDNIIERFECTGIVDMVDIQCLGNPLNVALFPSDYLTKMNTLLTEVSSYPSFEIVTIHDDFRASPLHCNRLRYHYKHILADLADSTVIDDLLSQLYGQKVTYNKYSPSLSKFIRQSNYAIC